MFGYVVGGTSLVSVQDTDQIYDAMQFQINHFKFWLQ